MHRAQIVDRQREIHKDENKSFSLQTFTFVLMNFYVRPYHFLKLKFNSANQCGVLNLVDS